MAKGRRLTSTQSDRLLEFGNYNYTHNQHNSEIGEDEVWSMVEDAQEHDHHDNHQYGGVSGEWTPRSTTESVRRSRRNQASHVGGLSLAFEDIQTTSLSTRIMHQLTGNGGPRGGKHVATSAPMNVPDWSKILRVDYSVESINDDDDDDDEDERVGDSGIEPPHEYLARSRKRNTMSVFEGVGRTLKGRDLSRVRDAVWSQTGFEG